MRRTLLAALTGMAMTTAAAATAPETAPRPLARADGAAEPRAQIAQSPAAQAVSVAQAPADTPRPAPRAAAALDTALDQVEARQWFAAARSAAAAGEVGEDLTTWTRLRGGDGGWNEYVKFIERRPDWPGLALLQREGESAVARAAPAETVVAYFAERAPQTSAGVIALVNAHERLGDRDAAIAEATRAWREMPLTRDAHDALSARYGEHLAAHHETRMEEMLWRNARSAATRMKPLMSPDWQRLADARLALYARDGGVDARIRAVPDARSDDPGLAHARFDWRMRAGNHDSAGELMRAQSTSAETLGRPEAWASDRHFLARRAMRAGDGQEAYDNAAHHHLSSGGNFAQLEWLAGYVALTYLEDAETAARHFRTLRDGVSTPISLSRAGYWEGRAHAAMGNDDAAEEAYGFAAQYQTAFYGLLAAEEAGVEMNPALTGRDGAPDWRGASFADDSRLAAAQLLFDAGRRGPARLFINSLAQSLPDDELAALGQFTLDMGAENLAVTVGKHAASRGVDVPQANFPIGELSGLDLPAPPELTLAIARRESEFDIAARSPAGALGLMQVVPGTAQMMADRLGEPYELDRLTTDPRYNARLGAQYLRQLSDEFGDSLILVAAGYNAGPGRPRRWVQEMGDPRDPGVDPIDWIEHVPFSETRNYIMRVAESMMVYRARLSDEAGEVRLREVLVGG